jgi:hypothetical protein
MRRRSASVGDVPRCRYISGIGQPRVPPASRLSQAVLACVGENLTQVRRSVYDQRILHWSLAIGFLVGLAGHVGGYLLNRR